AYLNREAIPGKVQAERNAKFICAFPRRSLSKRLRKVVQAESKSKFICVLPRRSLSKPGSNSR
ncbi:MAG: hypothetical protein K2L06_03065, partial [Alistipes sp.]|nr:hypothetical protein [Alistipes sp.]